MHHTFAWTASLAASTLTDVPPVNETVYRVLNSHLVLQRPAQLVAAMAMGTDLQRARFNSGTIRKVNPSYIRPIMPALVPADDPNFMNLMDHPWSLPVQEEVLVEAFQNNAGAQRFTCVAHFLERFVPDPGLPRYQLRATGTTAATANAWSVEPYALETGIPVGTYAVIGAEVFSTNCQAFRFTFDNQSPRPGGFGTTLINRRAPWHQYDGRLGVWGYFISSAPPPLEVLCNAADAAFEIYIQCMQISQNIVQF